MSGRLVAGADRQRRATVLLALAAVVYALLGGVAYLGINHHVPLYRAGLPALARIIAAHPVRWAMVLTAVGVVLLALVWRLIRAPVENNTTRDA